ncbi:hypothetical protein HanIR_Chr05g0226201 [Helianthus annuus]|nr:hypothetical protein HanIR_Chr05g0226201 [Helianthus annuus]
MKFLDWYLKIGVVSTAIGGSMEYFMIKTGFWVTRLSGHGFSSGNTLRVMVIWVIQMGHPGYLFQHVLIGNKGMEKVLS